MNGERLLRVAVMALSALPAACAAREYAAEPIDALVVDAGSGQPVAGALVIARWVAKGEGGLHAPRDLGSVEVLETVTGNDGRFHFAGWGPKAYDGPGVLLEDDPLILVYKRGYEIARLGNSQYGAPPAKDFRTHKTGPVRSSLWNGETISLKQFAGSESDFFRKAYEPFVTGYLWPMFAESTPCDWKKLPRTVAYVESEKKAFAAREGDAAAHTLASIRDRLVMNDPNFVKKGCGSPREYFREQRQ